MGLVFFLCLKDFIMSDKSVAFKANNVYTGFLKPKELQTMNELGDIHFLALPLQEDYFMRVTYHLITQYKDGTQDVKCLTCGLEEANRILDKALKACNDEYTVFLEVM